MDGQEEKIVSEETRSQIEGLVREPPWFLPIPDHLREGMETRRAKMFARLVGPGTPFVLLLSALIAFAGVPFFDVSLAHHDGRVWWGAEAVTGMVAVVGLILVRTDRLISKYTLVVAVGSALVLGSKLFETMAFQDRSMAAYAIYVCALTTNLIMLAFRLPPWLSLTTCFAGGGLALVAAFVFRVPLELDRFPFYVVASTAVSLGVAHFAERQERLNYLQGLLLAHESARSKRLNEELSKIARTDPLTGVANRRHFDAQLTIEWERARRSRESISLLFVDIDFFKAFNDTYGHPEGDVCLERVAGALVTVAQRPADLAARYGGEEFVVLLPNTEAAGARKLAMDVIAAVDRLAIPHDGAAAGAHVTVSVGAATLVPDDTNDESMLVREADANLYRAKSEGRHRASWLPSTTLAFMAKAPTA